MTCVHIVKDGTLGILGKKFGCDTLIFVSFIPLNMEENEVHFRYLMLFFYQKGKNATQAANKICAFYEGAVVETVRKNCGLLGLKLVISILKIKNARIGPPP